MPRLAAALLLVALAACGPAAETVDEVPQWTTHEIALEAKGNIDNPYTDVQVTATFVNDAGDTLRRPGFWDGGRTWRIRFAPPDTGRTWTWTTEASPADAGLARRGSLVSVPYQGINTLLQNGLLTMSPGRRNVVHRSGKAFLVVGDTPWALPFRATPEQARTYAEDRQAKGFNAALLMTLQPDMRAEGPDARDTDQGFARAFDDVSDGSLNQLNPGYFQTVDSLVAILIDHEIVPAYQPVFHGFGWKGLDVLGRVIDPDAYVRYTRYLLARYGSMPALWLIAGDNGGDDPGVREAGEMLEAEDAYGQPTGLHYNPCDDYVAEWAVGNPTTHCMHHNRSHQDAAWLDFQWAQTGHAGDHNYDKVARMYDYQPVKAVANGEPTYEGMNGGQNGLGWWQGEEAWMQWMSGGTMGVVYGAAALWQWKVSADEAGWGEWASQPLSWRQALDLEGSTYVGLFGRILAGLDITDIEKRWDLAAGQPLLAKEGTLYIAYLNEGGEISIRDVPDGLAYRWVDPRTGDVAATGTTDGTPFAAPDTNPWVLVITP